MIGVNYPEGVSYSHFYLGRKADIIDFPDVAWVPHQGIPQPPKLLASLPSLMIL